MDDGSKKPRHSRWAWAGLAMVVLVIGGAVAVFFARGGGSGADATAASGAVPARSVPAGSPGSADGGPSNAAWVALDQVRSAPGEPVLDGGKPLVYFMGAEWCPFCATERWALVEATSRFGKWSGLKELQSRSGQDFFPSLSTYDLSKATYTSDYISVRHTELQNVAGDTLQTLDSFEEGLVNEDDNRGSIPFLLATGSPGRYTVELGFSPGLLDGQSFASLRKEVADEASTPAAEAIDGQQPASVCAKGSIPALEAEIE